MQKNRKFIVITLIISVMFYTSNITLALFYECGCHYSSSQEIESLSDYDTEKSSSMQKEIDNNCCTINLENKGNFIESEINSCSEMCTFIENIDFEKPTLFSINSFVLKKTEKIEIAHNIIFNKSSSIEVNTNLITFSKEKTPQYFGKALIIKLHALKIPSYIS